jgi:hypothetical protein
VTKGSTAIRIWAPCPPSKRQLQAWRDADADPDDKPRTGWRLASVFAQDQVAELPPPAQPLPLDPPVAEIRGDSHEDLIAELVGFAGEIGYGDTGPADGICNAKDRRIAVAERLEANGRPRPVLVAGPVRIDLRDRRVSVDERHVELSAVEHRPLCQLAGEPTRVLTKVNFETRPEEGKGSDGFRGSGLGW